MGEKHLHDIDVAGARRDHQWSEAALLRGICLGARREQLGDRGFARVLAGAREGGDAVIVGRVHVRPGPQQRVDHVEVVPMRCPQQSRGAVRSRGVDVDALFQQRTDGLAVLVGSSLDEPHIAVGGRSQTGDRQHGHQPAASKGFDSGAHNSSGNA